MSTWIMPVGIAVLVLLAGTGLFFFAATRGALLVRALMLGDRNPAAHVYPIYTNMRLMRMVDFQPIIAAILLFQYDRLVSLITAGLRHQDLAGQKVLITSCAFGNVLPRVAHTAVRGSAERVQIVDIIQNELVHAQRKMPDLADKVEYLEQDATALALPDASVRANVMFFLLHELPDHLKRQALDEACRVLEPGGQLYLAEFHRPRPLVLRALSWTYFKVFEPLGLALWSEQDPLTRLNAMPGMSATRRVVFFGNFQVIVATKQG